MVESKGQSKLKIFGVFVFRESMVNTEWMEVLHIFHNFTYAINKFAYLGVVSFNRNFSRYLFWCCRVFGGGKRVVRPSVTSSECDFVLVTYVGSFFQKLKRFY